MSTTPNETPHAIDVVAADFDREVIARSSEVPVVVDFWAAWCGPCRTLGPILEQAVAARAGDVVLAKVDVDRDPGLAQRYGVRGIPAVKGFRDGQVVEQFTGAIPRPQVEAFLDRLAPSEADHLAATALRLIADDREEEARARFEEALSLDPEHRVAAIELARILASSDPARALDLAAPHRPDPAAEQVVTRAELARGGGNDLPTLRAQVADDPADGGARLRLGRALAARGDYAPAVDHLIEAVRAGDGHRDEAREQLVRLFGLLGDDHPLVEDARKRLANALF